MKGKRTKLGVLAAVGSIVALPGCNVKPKPYVINGDSVRLETKLLKLSKKRHKPEKDQLFTGAMCYIVMPVPDMSNLGDYVCPYCGDTVRNKYDKGKNDDIKAILDIVYRMGSEGYDVVLDSREFCPRCSGKNIESPELIFKIRFSDKGSYHIAKSNVRAEYWTVLDFLQKENAGKNLDKTNVETIQKMTGLGKDLIIEKAE